MQIFSPENDAAAISAAVKSFGEDFELIIWKRYSQPTSLSNAVRQELVTFRDVVNFFSEKAMLFWLRYHIASTFYFLGIYDQASKYQVRETARMILEHEVYGQFTCAEFLCFLQKFKMGEYGKIYQSRNPNPQEFLMCLKPFWEELSHERQKFEDEERMRSLEADLNDPDRMTYDEWKEIKTIQSMYEMKLNK